MKYSTSQKKILVFYPYYQCYPCSIVFVPTRLATRREGLRSIIASILPSLQKTGSFRN